MPANKLTTRKEVFDFIAAASLFGNLGLFVGAGLPMAIMNGGRKNIALSWPELIKRCCEKMGVNLNDIPKEGSSYPQIASAVCKAYMDKKKKTYSEAASVLKQEIARITCWYPETEERLEYATYFDSLDPAWVITTNYDTIIESILTGKGYSLGPDDYMVAQKGHVPVYHLHGIRTNPESIIITQEDYVTLFRPNQYRQQKLPLTIRESVTLLVGYNLGDFNVLTAVDWSRNVFTDQNANYPQDLIQLLYCKKPKREPYRDHNDILILEFDDLADLLADLKDVIDKKVRQNKKVIKESKTLNESMIDPPPEDVAAFVDEADFRKKVLDQLVDSFLVNGFLEFFNRAVELTWERAMPSGAFHAYHQQLEMFTDILISLDVRTMPPALVEAVASNLNRVAYFTGEGMGQSHSAYRHWKKISPKIPKQAITELEDIAQTRNYYNLLRLLEVANKEFEKELEI